MESKKSSTHIRIESINSNIVVCLELLLYETEFTEFQEIFYIDIHVRYAF